jgi:hypothetical protein
MNPITHKPAAIGFTEDEASRERLAKFEDTKSRFAERFRIAQQADSLLLDENAPTLRFRISPRYVPAWWNIHPSTFD